MARRRRFEPSGLVAGAVFLAIAAGGAASAAGRWHPSPVVLVPVLVFGMLITRLTRAVAAAVRRRGATRDADAAAASVSGESASR